MESSSNLLVILRILLLPKLLFTMQLLKREKIVLVLVQLLILSFLTSYYATIPIILLVLFFFYDKKRNIKRKILHAYKQPITLLFQGYFFIHILGLLYTENLDLGMNFTIRLLPFLILPIVLLGEEISKESQKKILLFFKNCVLVIFGLLLTYHFWYFNNGLEWFIHFGYKSLGIAPVYYATFILFSIFISDTYKNKYFYFELAILLFFLLLLANRSSLLFLLIYFAFYKKGYRLLKKPVISLSIITVISLLFLVKNPLSKKLNILKNTIDFDMEIIKTKNSITVTRNSLEHRIYIWSLATNIIKEHFLIGVGTGDFQKKLEKEYKKANFKAAIKNQYNTHNQFIEEFLKFGVFGGVFFILFFMYLLKTYSKNKLLFIVVFLIIWSNFFESYWSRHHGIIFSSIIILLLANTPVFKKNN